MYQRSEFRDIAVDDKLVANVGEYCKEYSRATVVKVTASQFTIKLKDKPLIDIVYRDNRRDYDRVEIWEVRFNKAGTAIGRNDAEVVWGRNGLWTWEELDESIAREEARKRQRSLARTVKNTEFKWVSIGVLEQILELVAKDKETRK